MACPLCSLVLQLRTAAVKVSRSVVGRQSLPVARTQTRQMSAHHGPPDPWPKNEVERKSEHTHDRQRHTTIKRARRATNRCSTRRCEVASTGTAAPEETIWSGSTDDAGFGVAPRGWLRRLLLLSSHPPSASGRHPSACRLTPRRLSVMGVSLPRIHIPSLPAQERRASSFSIVGFQCGAGGCSSMHNDLGVPLSRGCICPGADAGCLLLVCDSQEALGLRRGDHRRVGCHPLQAQRNDLERVVVCPPFIDNHRAPPVGDWLWV